MTVQMYATREPYYTVLEGSDGTDISVPLVAQTLAQALAGVARVYTFDEVRIKAIDVVDYGGNAKLLIVRTVLGPPTVLLFDPAPDAAACTAPLPGLFNNTAASGDTAADLYAPASRLGTLFTQTG